MCATATLMVYFTACAAQRAQCPSGRVASASASAMSIRFDADAGSNLLAAGFR